MTIGGPQGTAKIRAKRANGKRYKQQREMKKRDLAVVSDDLPSEATVRKKKKERS